MLIRKATFHESALPLGQKVVKESLLMRNERAFFTPIERIVDPPEIEELPIYGSWGFQLFSGASYLRGRKAPLLIS